MKRNNQKAILLLLGCLFFSESFGQITFQKIISGSNSDAGISIHQTPDMGYLLQANSGTPFASNLEDIYLVKMDSIGTVLWDKLYGGTDGDYYAYSSIQTDDGGFILSGLKIISSTNYQTFLIKTNSTGDTLWTKVYGGTGDNKGIQFTQTNDGGYIIVGTSADFDTSSSCAPFACTDVFLIKTDSIGDTLWCRAYGGSDYDFGSDVQQTPDGGYIVLGSTRSFGAGSDDIYLIKTNAAGDLLWTRTYGGAPNDGGGTIRVTADSGFIIAGSTSSFGAGSYDAFLLKTDSLGTIDWSKTYGGVEADSWGSVEQTSDGGYILGGSHGVGAFDSECLAMKTDMNGDTLWTKAYRIHNRGGITSMQSTADGGYIC
ncbi:MAG: hypothetical protein JKY18_12740, partial [Flavobacteriales bacterium]|nr:hypothetical protein [Flavobacteriales bacterium]